MASGKRAWAGRATEMKAMEKRELGPDPKKYLKDVRVSELEVIMRQSMNEFVAGLKQGAIVEALKPISTDIEQFTDWLNAKAKRAARPKKPVKVQVKLPDPIGPSYPDFEVWVEYSVERRMMYPKGTAFRSAAYAVWRAGWMTAEVEHKIRKPEDGAI